MAEWGGARPGAGRKRKADASPSRLARARARRKALRIERITDAKERARQWLRTFEPGLLADVFSSGDLKLQVEVWRTLKLYGDGSPSAAHVQINVATPAQIMAEIARERRQREAVTVPMLPEHTEPDA